MGDTLPIRPAATVAVTRAAAAGFEVLLLKRAAGAVFMPSMYVFPGGRIEAQDYAFAEALPEAEQRRALALLDAIDDAPAATAFCLAAVRETAEESGLLLARDAAGAWATPEAARAAFEALNAEVAFADVLAGLKLRPDLGALRPLGWWITPPIEPRRYDTRFFLAEAPPGHAATADAVETTAHAWLTPAEALRRFHAQALALAPPTLATLELLAAAATPEAALDGQPIRPIQPHPTRDADGTAILALPGDPLFPEPLPPALPHRTRFRHADGRRFE